MPASQESPPALLIVAMASLLALSVLLICSISATVPLVEAVSVSVPLSAPSDAATLNPSLLAFSIEQDRWTDWVGTTSTNTFFLNALNNIAQRTGETPWIRIGADSEDHTNFNPNVQVRLNLIIIDRRLGNQH